MASAADVFEVSPRTIRRWTSQKGPPARGRGRPRTPPEKRMRALRLVARERRRQGKGAGEGSMRDGLGAKGVSTWLLREMLRLLKGRSAERKLQRIAARRLRIRINGRNALWSGDEMHAGREAPRRPVHALMLQDAASTMTLDAAVGAPATGEDLVEQCRRAASGRGYPLAIATDRGGAQRSDVFERFLTENRIAHVMNVARTPQHNTWVERSHGEYRKEMELEGGETRPEIARRLEAARRILDENRIRTSKSGLTAAESDAMLHDATADVPRDAFYAAYVEARADATLGLRNARARQRAERAATLSVLERFGAITMTRGDAAQTRTAPAVVGDTLS